MTHSLCWIILTDYSVYKSDFSGHVNLAIQAHFDAAKQSFYYSYFIHRITGMPCDIQKVIFKEAFIYKPRIAFLKNLKA